MRHALWLIATVLALAVAGPAGAVVSGSPDTTHAYTGLLAEQVDGQVVEVCSGFLVSPTVLLTAGHCTDQILADGGEAVVSFAPSFDPAGPFVSGTPVTDPDFTVGKKTVQDDLGVVLLDSPVRGVGSAQLPSARLLDGLAKKGGAQDLTLVGYGASGFTQGGGPKQPVFTDTRLSASVRLVNLQNALSDGYNLQMSAAACFGDSGGPVLLAGSNTVVGVTSFGLTNSCTGGAFAARLDRPAALAFLSRYL
jgi:hypothetical protein